MRTVIREPEFDDELRALIKSASAADDFVAAAEWLLSHEPEIGSFAVQAAFDPYVLGARPVSFSRGAAVSRRPLRLQVRSA